MPDTGSSSSGRGGAAEPRGGGPWFTRKIGPLPAWGWGAVAVGVYYWYTHYGPGASKAAAAQQPAGGGLRTYAPRITETIVERVGARKPKPKRPHRKPKPKPPNAAAGPMVPAGTAPNPGGPVRKPGPHGHGGGPPPRPKPRPKPPPPPPGPPPAPVPEGPEQVASADYAPAGFQTGGAVNADTGQPVYWEWQHKHRGPEIAEPVQAYAPMTNGSVYDAGSTAAELAAG